VVDNQCHSTVHTSVILCETQCDLCTSSYIVVSDQIERVALHNPSYTSDQRAGLASFAVLYYTRRGVGKKKKKSAAHHSMITPQSAAACECKKHRSIRGSNRGPLD
jgi:hypothetical protein